MEHTEKYLQAKWVSENPEGYDDRDVLDANRYISAYMEGYNQALSTLDVVEQSEEFPSREDAYKEGLIRKRRHEKNIVWKAKIFAAGSMWAKMKLTGISDVIGNNS